MTQLHEAHGIRVSTAELNRILKAAWDRQPPSVAGRRAPKLFYCAQVNRAPPRFVLFTNLTKQPHFSYIRYLENILRKQLTLEGVPIRVMIKGRQH
jgi:GTP-binding protein